MKGLAVYWFIGCLIVGFGGGLFDKRCPNDEYMIAQNILLELVAWPAGIFAAIVNPTLKPCRPRA